MGQLTRQEAEALERFLTDRGPLVVGVLDTPPSRPRAVGGLDEYLRTALVVQEGLETDRTVSFTPVRELVWDVIASGNQASAGDTPIFEIASTQDEFVRLWNMAYGSQLNLPPIPPINFGRESVLGFFLGTRPTGGLRHRRARRDRRRGRAVRERPRARARPRHHHHPGHHPRPGCSSACPAPTSTWPGLEARRRANSSGWRGV